MAQANSQELPEKVGLKLQALLDHLMYITRPDGTTPLFGDDDGGRLLMLEHKTANDFRSTLATGAAFFARGDYKFVARDCALETLWLLGAKGVRDYEDLKATEPGRTSVGFADGGYYVMRDDWSPTANYLLFDCGPHGTANCGHAHADALAFELAANGHTLLVDPGTYTYTGSKEMRDWFRSSTAHNTLTIDEEPSSVSAGPFSWQTIASSICLSWLTQPRFDYLAATHDGYLSLGDPTEHVRSVLFLKRDYWIIRDRIRSRGEHEVKLWFHFAAGVAPLSSKNDVHVLCENGGSARLQLTTCATGGAWTREPGWVSSCYGQKEEAPVFAISVRTNGVAELITFLLPQTSGAQARPAVREVEATEGRAFEISHSGKCDLLLLRGLPGETAGRVETARLASDFEVTWARFANEHARAPEELVLIGGQQVEFEGRKIVNSDERVEHLVLRRMDDRFVNSE